MTRTADKEALKKIQWAWLKTRRDVCPDVACLQRAYQERIAELSRSNSTAAMTVQALPGGCPRMNACDAGPCMHS